MTASKGDVNLAFKKFNLSNMQPNCVILACARRNSGKSVLVREILYHLRDIPIGYVVSGTEEATGFFNEFVPSICIRSKYTPELIKNLIDRQKEKIKQAKSDPSIDPRAFLVFDDCLHDKRWVKDEVIREVFFNGRHYGITFIFTMQYAVGVPPHLRGNIDYVFLLSEPYFQIKKKLYECYAGMFKTFDVFEQTLDQITENFGILCIHSSSRSKKIADMVYWYRAKDPGNFRVCCEKIWRLDEAAKLQKQKNENCESDELQLMRNAPRVYVKKLMEE